MIPEPLASYSESFVMIAATVSRWLQIKLETSFQSYKDIWPAIIAPRQTMCSGCMQTVSLACCSGTEWLPLSFFTNICITSTNTPVKTCKLSLARCSGTEWLPLSFFTNICITNTPVKSTVSRFIYVTACHTETRVRAECYY